jgi:regulator of nucleoside diphosphate kinase
MLPENTPPTGLKQPFSRPRIVITASDYARLVAFAERPDRTPIAEYLSDELTRASIVDDDKLAADVVRMGSLVTYRDLASDRTRTIALVFPQEADMARNRVSVLTPIGAALIGLAVGLSIDWPTPEGRSGTLTVIGVSNDEDKPS